MTQKLTYNQYDYRSLYSTLGTRKRKGLDVDGNGYSDQLRRQLFKCWLRMTKAEREPFLAPGCLARDTASERHDYRRQRTA